MRRGFIYVLANDAMPNVVKIGKTTRHPVERANELWTTGVPEPFQIVFAMLVDDMDAFEAAIHREFFDCRLSESREFFRINHQEVVLRILDLFAQRHDHVVTYSEFAIEGCNVWKYHTFCQCPTVDVINVIDMFTPQEWACAAARLKQKRLLQVAGEELL